jgi:hypothetical protein
MPISLVSKLEAVANAVFVVAALFLLALLTRNFAGQLGVRGPVVVRPNDILTEPPGYSWSAHDRTVVLVLKARCEYCEASVPFYRRLVALDSAEALSGSLLAVFPDPADTVRTVLREEGLAIDYRAGVSLAPWKVTGTPTLLVVSSSGRVLQVWRGRLSREEEELVVETIRASAVVARSGLAPRES